jgi:hypothetical protein
MIGLDPVTAAPLESWPLLVRAADPRCQRRAHDRTATYNRRVSGDEEREKGLGVVWKSRIKVLGWLGGVVVVFAGGIRAVVTFFYSPHPPPPAPDINIETPGSVAAGRDIHGSTITVQPLASPSASPGSPDPGSGR